MAFQAPCMMLGLGPGHKPQELDGQPLPTPAPWRAEAQPR